MDINKTLRQAVLAAIPARYENLTALAKDAGVSQGTLNLFVNEKRESMQWDTAWKILEKLEYSLVDNNAVDPYEYIPKVKAKAGAGSSLITSGEIVGHYPFRRDFLSTAHICANHAVMLDVLGSSMEPLIRDKDTILVDESKTTLKDGEIFLVGLEEELLVKRVQKTLRGWILRSENKEVSDIPVEGAELDQFRVYGQVRWFGRVL